MNLCIFFSFDIMTGNSSDFKFIINLDAAKILKLAEELISRSQKVHDAVASVPLEKVFV